MTEYRQYENGVADLLAFLLGRSADVQRNVKLSGRLTGKNRQIDVLVSGEVFGLRDARMVVDTKRWNRKIDVRGVEAFLGLVEDVGADLGLLVTTAGTTDGARERIRTARGTRIEVVTLQQLRAWRPPGTVGVSYRIPVDRIAEAEDSLRHAGFRVTPRPSQATVNNEVEIEVFRHYGDKNPSGDIQREHSERAGATMNGAGIPFVRTGSGVTVGGGTPAHRWLDVTLHGAPSGLRVLASSEDDVDRELDSVAEILKVTRHVLDVRRPDDWPVAELFGLLSQQSSARGVREKSAGE